MDLTTDLGWGGRGGRIFCGFDHRLGVGREGVWGYSVDLITD